jgi:hypothetical protein
MDLTEAAGNTGRSKTAADVYRRYAAECVSIAQREVVHDKAMLLEMARMWLRLAKFAERSEGTDNSLPA